jgi:hypothetical protein
MAIAMVRRTREQNTVAVEVPDPVPTNPVSKVASTVAAILPIHPVPETVRAVARRGRKRASRTVAERAQDKYADVILSGAELPSLRRVMTDLKVGQDKAREARAPGDSQPGNGPRSGRGQRRQDASPDTARGRPPCAR